MFTNADWLIHNWRTLAPPPIMAFSCPAIPPPAALGAEDFGATLAPPPPLPSATFPANVGPDLSTVSVFFSLAPLY